jgi:hypothetical protein
MKAANQPPTKEAHPENLGATNAAIGQLGTISDALLSGKAVLMHYHNTQKPSDARHDEVSLTVRVLVEKPQ